jgi:hydrocephalus-inducing protein
VENLGSFDFKYSIYKLIAREAEVKSGGGVKQRGESRKGQKGRVVSPGTERAPKIIKDKKEVFGKKDQATDVLSFGAFKYHEYNTACSLPLVLYRQARNSQ